MIPLAHVSGDVVNRQMQSRNAASAVLFEREAERLAQCSRQMSEHFARGGRLLAFGADACASDAQHVAVEFVHPVLVGKRALPALDLSTDYRELVPAMLRPGDIAIGFGPPQGDRQVETVLAQARARGALCLALPGSHGDYCMTPPSPDPFIHQELVETLYHMLWETVHVFLDRQALGQDAGAAAFLYPFLAHEQRSGESIIQEVAASVRSKAGCVERLRMQVATGQADAIAAAVMAIRERVDRGGVVLSFGNGGSATDATDLATDLVTSPKDYASVPAMSLAADSATLTAIANDVGTDAVFARQVIAHGRPHDVAVAISTSGGSSNIIAALREARARGLLTVALLGYDGGEVARRRLADHILIVPSDQIPRVQEVQASIYHIMLDMLEALRRSR